MPLRARQAPPLLLTLPLLLSPPLACDLSDEDGREDEDAGDPSDQPLPHTRLLAGDLDQDGLRDVVRLHHEHGETIVQVFRGLADDQVERAADSGQRLPFAASAATLADLDLGGCLDLVLVSDAGVIQQLAGLCAGPASGSFKGPRVLQYDGDPHLLAGARALVPLISREELLGFAGVSGDAGVWCLDLDGERGVTTHSVSLEDGARLESIATADLDLDEEPDLAVLDANGAEVQVLMGVDATCRFEQAATIEGARGREVALEDVDWDGRVDLLELDRRGVTLRRGGATPTEFGRGEALDVGDAAAAFLPTDIDRDRHFAILVGPVDHANTATPSSFDLARRPLVIRPEIEPIFSGLDPDELSDCEGRDDTAALQAALDGAAQAQPAVVQLQAGTYCLRDPLHLRSGVTLRGVSARLTRLQQDGPADSGLLIDRTAATTIEDLEVRLSKSQDFLYGKNLDVDCLKQPAQDSCQFRLGRGIVAYGTSGLTVRRVRTRGGVNGLYLSDSPDLEEPGLGLVGGVRAIPSEEDPMSIIVQTDVCTPMRTNRDAVVERVEASESGNSTFEIHNLSRSLFLRNLAHDAGKLDQGGAAFGSGQPSAGLKFTCGPVRWNLFLENYAFHNSEEGMDAAWAHPEEKAPLMVENPYEAGPETLPLRIIDGPPDGLFAGNWFVRNAFFRNAVGGLELKSRGASATEMTPEFGCAATCGLDQGTCEQNVGEPFTPLDPDSYLRLGQLGWVQNLFLDNFTAPENTAATAGDIHLARVVPLHGCGPFDEEAGVRGLFLQNISWRRDPDVAAITTTSRLALESPVRHISFVENWFGSVNDSATPLVGDPGAQWGSASLPTSGNTVTQDPDAPAAATIRDQLLQTMFGGAEGFGCEDTDQDGCVNGCEAILGGSPHDANSTPAACASCEADYCP